MFVWHVQCALFVVVGLLCLPAYGYVHMAVGSRPSAMLLVLLRLSPLIALFHRSVHQASLLTRTPGAFAVRTFLVAFPRTCLLTGNQLDDYRRQRANGPRLHFM